MLEIEPEVEMRKKSQIEHDVHEKTYLMESEEETIRLEVKTDPDELRRQALWCGIKPGMRVLDVACGPGKTTSLLYEMIQPGGSIVGIDYSESRIQYARKNYGKQGIEFIQKDFREKMQDIGEFDLVWVRFVLEYYREEAFNIVSNLKEYVREGGTLCLLDLDYNCLSHFELPDQLAVILPKIMNYLNDKYNFDVFAGRKLYSFLYDAGFEDIDVKITGNSVLFGNKKDSVKYDWLKKIEIASIKAKEVIDKYHGGYIQLSEDFRQYLENPKSFTYTPLIVCKGTKITTVD